MLLLIPGGLQGIFILLDEFLFHQRRRLGPWEIFGHPLDTLSVIIPFIFLMLSPTTEQNLWIYFGLCLFSSILITKDEFVHTELCSGYEHWLHAILFILHPISFFTFALLWVQNEYRFFLIGQSVLIFIFLIYQIIYWGKPWELLLTKKLK
jgi:hypothetical protein